MCSISLVKKVILMYNVRMWNIDLDIKENERIGVAVSGGRDSMALLHIIVKRINAERIVVVNIEHGIRGQKSKDESEFVVSECRKLNVSCISIIIDTLSYQKEKKLTTEQAARELRYKEFYRLLNEGVIDKIALAHHKSDQCETIIMRILRGTGINGLSGMPANREGKFIRPLLNISRKEINHFIKANNIEYVDDDSNANNDYTRNYIRNTIFPAIAVKFPDFENSIVRLSMNATEDNDYIMSNVIKPVTADNIAIIPLNCLTLPRSLSGRSIMLCFNSLGITADIERRHIDAIIGIISLNNGDSLDMPFGVKVYKEYNELAFVREDKAKSELKLPFGAGTIELNDKALEVTEYKGEGLRFDLDKIPEGAVIRFRERGDYFNKFGGKRKSLSDYMTDIKLPRRLRDHIPLVAAGSEILIVTGYEISNNIIIDQSSKRQYTINIRSKNGY